MKKSKSLKIIAVPIVLLLSVLLVSCGWHHMTIEKKADKIAGKISSKLDLNKDQKAVLYKIKDETIAKIKSQKTARIALHNEFVVIIKSGSVDQAKLQALNAKRNELSREIQNFMIGKFADFYKILTQPQKDKLVKILEKRNEKIKKFL
jgi:Spy/CpxP family protein refolding chaperone